MQLENDTVARSTLFEKILTETILYSLQKQHFKLLIFCTLTRERSITYFFFCIFVYVKLSLVPLVLADIYTKGAIKELMEVH